MSGPWKIARRRRRRRSASEYVCVGACVRTYVARRRDCSARPFAASVASRLNGTTRRYWPRRSGAGRGEDECAVEKRDVVRPHARNIIACLSFWLEPNKCWTRGEVGNNGRGIRKRITHYIYILVCVCVLWQEKGKECFIIYAPTLYAARIYVPMDVYAPLIRLLDSLFARTKVKRASYFPEKKNYPYRRRVSRGYSRFRGEIK